MSYESSACLFLIGWWNISRSQHYISVTGKCFGLSPLGGVIVNTVHSGFNELTPILLHAPFGVVNTKITVQILQVAHNIFLCMVYDEWCMVYDVWCMVCDV